MISSALKTREIFKYILTVRKFECQKAVIEPSNLFKSQNIHDWLI